MLRGANSSQYTALHAATTRRCTLIQGTWCWCAHCVLSRSVGSGSSTLSASSLCRSVSAHRITCHRVSGSRFEAHPIDPLMSTLVGKLIESWPALAQSRARVCSVHRAECNRIWSVPCQTQADLVRYRQRWVKFCPASADLRQTSTDFRQNSTKPESSNFGLGRTIWTEAYQVVWNRSTVGRLRR